MKIKEKFQEIYNANIEGYGDAEMFEEYVANEG